MYYSIVIITDLIGKNFLAINDEYKLYFSVIIVTNFTSKYDYSNQARIEGVREVLCVPLI